VRSAFAPGANGVLVDLPQGAQIIAPADGTQMVDAQTEFSWGAFPGGVFTIDFIAPGHGPTFHIVTGGTRTTLPQLAAVPMPSGVTYAWTVTASAPCASVDAAADPHALIPQGNTVLQSFSDGLGFTHPLAAMIRPGRPVGRPGRSARPRASRAPSS
jgi:hypothetical protein